MKILHIIRGLENSSGTTHIVGPMAEEQAKLGHEVSVWFVEKDSPPVVPDPALVESRAFPVTLVGGHPGVSLPFAREIVRRAGDFDVMHVHAVWNFPSMTAMRAARRRGLPYMVAPQGSLEPWALASGSPVRKLYAQRVEGPLLRRASAMQALTRTEADQFRSFGITAPAYVIPNGVMPDWLDGTPNPGGLAADLDLPAGARTLLFLSRIHPKKGLDVLLRGFARFASGAPDVVLAVAGGDAGSGYLDQMKALAGALELGDRVRFLGEVRGEQKRRILAGADAYALSSHSEGLPVAVVEAMASGLPVLITPGCNIPEAAEAQAGLIVTPQVDAVAAGLTDLFGDADRFAAMGANGRALVAERFTWPRIAAQAVDAYGAIAATARKAA